MLINELIPDYGQPGCKTGNVFMTGNPVMGAADCFEKLINNSIGERIPVFLFHNYFSAEKKRRLLFLAGVFLLFINNQTRNQALRRWDRRNQTLRRCRGREE